MRSSSATELIVAEVQRITVPATDGNGELPPMTKRPQVEVATASKLSGVKEEIVSRGVNPGDGQTAVRHS